MIGTAPWPPKENREGRASSLEKDGSVRKRPRLLCSKGKATLGKLHCFSKFRSRVTVEEIKDLFMSQPKLIRFGSGQRKPFVADPELVPCDIDALDRRKAPASPNDPVQLRLSKHLCQHGIRLPHLVAGLPWRFARDTERPIVPEMDFVPLDLILLQGSGRRS
jgi:hypothetical protein